MRTNIQEATTAPADQSSEKPLQGWKEIASYLERDVRTARRWEKTAALPIRRLHEDRRSSVYSFPSEIEAWQRSRGAEEVGPKGFLSTWAKFTPVAAVLALIVAGWLLVRGPILNPEHPYAEAANPSGAAATQVWAEADTDGTGAISLDGRYLAYNDWPTGNIAVRDLETGENRILTKKTNWDRGDYASFPVFSSDGAEIAYTWFREEAGRTAGYELRIVNRDGTGDRLIYTNDELDYLVPKAWFADGRILTWVRRKDRTAQITTVSAEDGALQPIKSLDWNQEGPFRLSPDSRWVAYQSPEGIRILAADGGTENLVVPTSKESEVVDWTPDGAMLLFASERTGQKALWSISVHNGVPHSKPKMLKADFGARNAVGITSDGSLFYAILSGGHDIYSVAFDFQSARLLEAPSVLIRSQVGNNSDPLWSRDGKQIAYKRQRQIRIENLKTGQGHLLAEFQGYTRLTDWSADGRFLICTSYGDESGRRGMYRVDANTGDVKLLKETNEGVGMRYPRWSRDGKGLYFRRETLPPNAGTAVWFLDVETGEEREIYPDGDVVAVSPADGRLAVSVRGFDGGSRLIVIDDDGENERELVRLRKPDEFNYPRWTPDGQFVLYERAVVKGHDSVRELWVVSAEGGQARRLPFDVPAWPVNFSIHPDGKRIAIGDNASRGEVWKLENFLPGPATD